MAEPIGIPQKLEIILSETQGRVPVQYMQILSEDGFSMNIVLIAPEFVVNDQRQPKEEPREG